MTDLHATLSSAHGRAARALGTLALALARRRVSGALVAYVAHSLREVADALDALVGDER